MSRRVLVVSHRPPDQPGGAAARWRSLIPELESRGWTVEVVTSSTADGLAATGPQGAPSRGARLTDRLRPLARRAFAVLRIAPPPRSTAWLLRGATATRRRLSGAEVVVATGPPMVALLAARLALIGSNAPFVAELRDLWAGNPTYDAGSTLLPRLERWIFARAETIVVCTEEAAADVRRRHPQLADRCRVVPNGFEPRLLERRRPHEPWRTPLRLLHSGVLTEERPLAPLLAVLAEPRLRGKVAMTLHGFAAPAIIAQLAAAPPDLHVELLPPSGWEDAVARIADCDAALLVQAHGAGDATAVASKVYEYLALGKPVLCITDGGATEALLTRLGADDFCARLGDPDSIRAAVVRLLEASDVEPVAPARLAPYSRTEIAATMADTLTNAAAGRR